MTKIIVSIVAILIVGGVIWFFWSGIVTMITAVATAINNFFTAFTTTPAQKIEQKQADVDKENERLKAGGVPEQGDW